MNKQKKLLIDQIMGQVEEYTLVCSELGTPFDDPATVLKKAATWKNLINLLKQSICTKQNQQDAETEEIQSPILSELSTHLEKWRRAIVLTQVYKFENDPTDWNSELESIDYVIFALSEKKAQMKNKTGDVNWLAQVILSDCGIAHNGNSDLYERVLNRLINHPNENAQYWFEQYGEAHEKIRELKSQLQATQEEKYLAPEPAIDFLKTIIPFDITIGGGKISKGCTLKTLLVRFQVLHRMAMSKVIEMTKKRPTKTGWFWYKLEGSWALQPCYVFTDGNDLFYTLDSIGCNERNEDLDGLCINEADVDTLWSKEPIENFVMGAT